MRKNQIIRRNRRSKDDQKSFLFTARKDLWREVEETTHALDVSVSAFIRESLRRNVALYKNSKII